MFSGPFGSTLVPEEDEVQDPDEEPKERKSSGKGLELQFQEKSSLSPDDKRSPAGSISSDTLEECGRELSKESENDCDTAHSSSPITTNKSFTLSGYHHGPSPDWSSFARPSSHIFVATLSSVESCFLNNDCKGSGTRLKCVSCHIFTHESCARQLSLVFPCRTTFMEDVRKYREHSKVEHHWVQRKNLKGKCKHCAKAFQTKLAFGSSKDVVGVTCSWCKHSYHSKESCWKAKDQDQHCDLGAHASIIVPPFWIIKVPRRGSFKSSLKTSPNKRRQYRQMSKQDSRDHDFGGTKSSKPFLIKPIPSKITPVLVFLNPKSGGNQGAKLMQKFQWLLNPRQVFDLTHGGPQPAIEMYKTTPNLKMLACGGDGTVGWVLSVLDKVKIDPHPAVSVLPLGTGNDLSRSLGWGGGYIDEPISKILDELQNAEEVMMDRWQLRVTKNYQYTSTEKGQDALPLDVVNNYFSLGVDAQIALQFHEAREANPQKFNSRIRNKMFYGQAGGKDLLLRKWKDLSDEITVICDGKDITPKLQEHRVHSVLFANIPSFGSGTRPWDPSKGEQKINDGKIEVIGLTTYQLPMLQAGSRGTCITQCSRAKIITKKTIPMQVDGEAVRLNPAEIELTFLNQARMLSNKTSNKAEAPPEDKEVTLSVRVDSLSMADYSCLHHDIESLVEVAKVVGTITVTDAYDLDKVRSLISPILERKIGQSKSDEWTFIDPVTASRFFRIDREQEILHFITDIIDGSRIFILLDTEEVGHDEFENPLSREQADAARVESENNNTKKGQTKKAEHLVESPTVEQILEKNTEGVLKAARLGDIHMLTELHTHGYSLLSIDETGKTALHYAARFGHKEIVKFLIANAPHTVLDMTDNEKGQTALHKAAGYKRRTICCMLIAAGANPLIKDQSGLVPRELADLAEDADLAAYLESQESFHEDTIETRL